MFTVDYEEAAGIVRYTSGGFLSLDEVRSYGLAVQDALARSRRRFGSVRMLVLSVDSVIQSAEVMEAVREDTAWMSDPDDRMAIVISSSLARMQAARTFGTDRQRAFATEAEARTWLGMDRPGAQAAL